MEQIIIEVQDFNNNWMQVSRILKTNDQVTMVEMRQAQSNFPGKRVRAVDETGRIIDLLG